jgi:PIN domain nuclease of toxin-antitoxin system
MGRNNFELLPIIMSHATMVESLAIHHRDPFDRLLVAQALTEGISLASPDTVFDDYGVS